MSVFVFFRAVDSVDGFIFEAVTTSTFRNHLGAVSFVSFNFSISYRMWGFFSLFPVRILGPKEVIQFKCELYTIINWQILENSRP